MRQGLCFLIYRALTFGVSGFRRQRVWNALGLAVATYPVPRFPAFKD